MTDQEQKTIFARNLNRILKEQEKTQREIATALGISPQAVNLWCKGSALPRMGKIQRLADYLRVPKSHLIEDYDPADIEKEKSIQVLVTTASSCELDDIRMATEMLLRLAEYRKGITDNVVSADKNR